jgi:hypothetical protein
MAFWATFLDFLSVFLNHLSVFGAAKKQRKFKKDKTVSKGGKRYASTFLTIS